MNKYNNVEISIKGKVTDTENFDGFRGVGMEYKINGKSEYVSFLVASFMIQDDDYAETIIQAVDFYKQSLED